MSKILEQHHKFLVLVVDDSKYMRYTLRQEMEKEGCEVIEAEDGVQAIRKFELYKPDIVLIDCVMPMMDGVTACRNLRLLPGGSQTPVIMITSLVDEKTVNSAFEAGATDYIAKPINFAVLRNRVGRILKAKRTEASLDKSEAFAKSIIEYALDGIIIINSLGIIKSFNPASARIFGYLMDEAVDEAISKLIPGIFCSDDNKTIDLTQAVEEVKAMGTNWEANGKRKDGTIFPIEISVSEFHLGDKPLFILILRDISERKLAEEALRESEERYRTLTENAYDLISEISKEGKLLYVSPNWTERLGYVQDELVGKNYSDIIYPEDKSKVIIGLERIMDNVTFDQIVYRCYHKNGELRWFESTGKTYQAASGNAKVVFVSRDITERQRYEDQILYQAFHDSLTGLPNRLLLKDRLSQEIAHANRNEQKIGVLFLDLDRFKIINDTLGHAAGDQLLKIIADRLIKCVRSNDTVARLGGDEFTMLITGILCEEDIVKVAKKVLEVIRQPIEIDEHQLYVSASIGIAFFPDDGKDVGVLLKNADAAMYLAKENGRNNYQLYTPAMNEKAAERLVMENSLRRALEKEEFALYYQPRVNTTTGELVGMEALIRWNHPELGIVNPGDFIPLAEETGLIVPIGEWVLYTACSQNKAWQEAGLPPVRVAVNISARQFQLQNFIETISRILEATRLEPQWLELEITETVAMQNAEYTVNMLKDLKNMGIDLSIDDFGTGYSSLSYLKRFPISKLKIDKSFVGEIDGDSNNAAIASTVIVLGKSLKFGVVAEGVENQAQLDFLKKHQCEEMQGYFFGKPMPVEEFSSVLSGAKKVTSN